MTIRMLAAAILLAAMPAAAHDWYRGYQSPSGRGSCCGSRDCRPLTSDEIRLSEAGELEVLDLGTWWLALDARWYTGSSPDGSWHLCRYQTDWMPRCVFGGMGT